MQTKKIRIKKETYERLLKRGKQGETINDILKRILDSIDKIETRNMKETQPEKSIMDLRATNRFEWIPH